MFPHATCLCVNTAQQRERNVDLTQLESHQHNQCHQSTTSNDCSEHPDKQSRKYSWIIQRHVDFVKINVLSPLQATSILQNTKYQLCNRQQVSRTHSNKILCDTVVVGVGGGGGVIVIRSSKAVNVKLLTILQDDTLAPNQRRCKHKPTP